jgi:hypothetical protein
MPLFLVGPDGNTVLSLGEFPGAERHGYTVGGRLRGSGPRPLGRTMSLAIGTGRLYVGTADTYEIRGYSMQGTLDLLIRKETGDLRVSDEDVARFKERTIEEADNEADRRRLQRWYRDMQFPDFRPAYARLLVDAEGNLWVEDYRVSEDEPATWTVFDPDGVFRATITAPPDLHIFEVGEDYVLGKCEDELDVEHVQLYELIKP